MDRYVTLHPGKPPVLRLGLASRGNTTLAPRHVRLAMDRGINYLNWCGHEDGVSHAIAELTPTDRESITVACQFSARNAVESERELDSLLRSLKTGHVDVLTFYYVESQREWEQICAPGGAMGYLLRAREQGRVGMLGLTTHQRPLATRWASSGLLDLLMVRYNAAHRGAEEEIFPVTRKLGIPVVAFTCLRWGALLQPLPGDGSREPIAAPRWYRFVLSNRAVAVALMAPDGEAELLEDLSLLDAWKSPEAEELALLRARGDEVRRVRPRFP